MNAQIKIKMDNAAFDEDPAVELARILHDIAHRIERGEIMAFNLQDINGNTVGKFKVQGRRN